LVQQLFGATNIGQIYCLWPAIAPAGCMACRIRLLPMLADPDPNESSAQARAAADLDSAL